MRRKRKKRKHFAMLLILIAFAGWLLLRTPQKANPLQGSSQSQTEFAAKANRYLAAQGETVQLQLQTDERWKNETYGYGEKNNTLGENGCALTALAMMQSILQVGTCQPSEILDWSGNDYYVPGQGTSWEIFPSFARDFGYRCGVLDTPDVIESKLLDGVPLIVSVKKGEFTTTGHIMVIKADSEHSGKLRVFDPNDTAEKHHYKQLYDIAEVLPQTVQAWAIEK